MTNPLAGLGVREKLTRSNYLLSQSQVLPPLLGNRLMQYIEGKEAPPPEYITGEKDGKATSEPNPAYDARVAMDQHVLSFLVNTLSPDILVTTIRMETASEVWGRSRRCLPPDVRSVNYQLGTLRERYDEHNSKFFLSKKPMFNRPIGKTNHF
jgi:hypothetical protein